MHWVQSLDSKLHVILLGFDEIAFLAPSLDAGACMPANMLGNYCRELV